jgi:prepilin-type N-terminal cleavage/methylation domain-containing protein
MRYRTNQAGFSVVELVIVLGVVGVLGFVGYGVYDRQNAKITDSSTTDTSQTASSQSAKANDVASAPTVSSTNDLDKASAILNQTDPSGSNNTDASQLNSQLSTF